MGRNPDPLRKSDILESLVDYAFAHGLSDFSLRPVADALGTSPRMLLYHFGSKEELLVQTVEACRARQYVMLERWLVDEGASFADVVDRFWRWVTSREAEAYLRLFFEVFGLAVQRRSGFEAFARSAVAEPLAFFEHGLMQAGTSDPFRARRDATILVAVVRGLLMDLIATGDRARVDVAFREFHASLFSQPTAVPAG